MSAPDPQLVSFCVSAKVPPPSAVKVTELSGNYVRLQWEAAAASDVVVYQIKWNVLGEAKSQEVWSSEHLRWRGACL